MELIYRYTYDDEDMLGLTINIYQNRYRKDHYTLIMKQEALNKKYFKEISSKYKVIYKKNEITKNKITSDLYMYIMNTKMEIQTYINVPPEKLFTLK